MDKLTSREATEILKRVELPASSNKITLLALAHKSERQKCIQDLDAEHREDAAAIEIQRLWRGYTIRCLTLDYIHPRHTEKSQADHHPYQQSSEHSDHDESFAVLSHDKFTSKPSSETSEEDILDYNKSGSKLRREYRMWLEYNDPISFDDYLTMVKQSVSPDEGSFGHPPSIASGRSTRFSVFLKTKSGTAIDTQHVYTPEKTLSARSLQYKSSHFDYMDNTNETQGLTRSDAAIIIQKAWRTHVDTQVFRYYRDLISFKSRGDPSLLLRCINPREAELLDSGSGTHVKFRLAGSQFPPNIYYKIFTHRPIIDMCANSPKDYTKANQKRIIAKQCNNKVDITTNDKGEKNGWYQRWENNGWRLVSDRILKRIDEDAFAYDSAQQKIEFKHTKLLRRQDVEKKRKKKKIEWMKKMYQEGMLWSKQGTDSCSEKTLGMTIQQMASAVDQFGHGIVDDWEVDELIDWTNGLNYDHYLTDWKEFATSVSSDQLSGG